MIVLAVRRSATCIISTRWTAFQVSDKQSSVIQLSEEQVGCILLYVKAVMFCYSLWREIWMVSLSEIKSFRIYMNK